MADIYFNDPNLRRSVTRMGTRGAEAEDEYYRRAVGYDPASSIQTAAMGAFNAMKPHLARSLRDYREGQVASGRITAGSPFRGEDELVESAHTNLTNTIAQNAMNAESLKLRNMEGLADYGSGLSREYVGAVSDLNATAQARRDEERRSKRAMWGKLLGSVIQGGAAVLSGPAGMALFGAKTAAQAAGR